MFAASVYIPSTNQIIINGGWNGKDESYSDTWSLDVDALSWSKLSLQNSTHAPSARHGHTMSYIPYNNNIIIFGGFILPTETLLYPQYSNELRVLDLNLNSWVRLSRWSKQPSGRYGHTAYIYPPLTEDSSVNAGCSILMIGGWGSGGCQSNENSDDPLASQVLRLDIDTWEWSAVEVGKVSDEAADNSGNLGTVPAEFSYSCTFNHAMCAYPTTTTSTATRSAGTTTSPTKAARSSDKTDDDEDDDREYGDDDDDEGSNSNTGKKSPTKPINPTSPTKLKSTQSPSPSRTRTHTFAVKDLTLPSDVATNSLLIFGGYDGKQASRNTLRFEFSV